MKVYKPGDPALEKEPFAYIAARDGPYLLKRNGFFDACVRIAALPGIEEQREFFRLKAGRIPRDLFLQALAFMRKVYEMYETEALLLLTFEDGRWGLHVPQQEVGGASVRYANRDKVRAVGSIHSHPGFAPTPSGTDEHDEMAFDGVHIIVSHFHPIPQAMASFAVVNGRRFPIKPEDLIEGLEGPEVAVPDAWLANVSGIPKTQGLWNSPRQGADAWQGGLWEREDALADKKPVAGGPVPAREFYKTVFRVTMLSQSPVSPLQLQEITELIAGEDCSGDVAVMEQKAITAEECARLASRQGSDPSIFGLDDEGNAIE